MKPVVPESMKNYVTDWHMSPGLVANGFLFLTGMTGAGPDGTVDPDPEVQIKLAFERANDVLTEAGASFAGRGRDDFVPCAHTRAHRSVPGNS